MPVSTFEEYNELMRQRCAQGNFVSCILFVNPNNMNNYTVAEIVERISFFHKMSGNYITFFMPGFYQDFIEGINKCNCFEEDSYVNFIKDLEKVCTWRHSCETEILFLNMIDGSLDFSYVYCYQIEKLISYGMVRNFSELFNSLRIAVEKTGNFKLGRKAAVKVLDGIAHAVISEFKNVKPLINALDLRPRDYRIKTKIKKSK